MNFGQPVKGISPVPYRIELNTEEFVELIRAPYSQFLRETIEDEAHDDGTFEEINRLREHGWPDVDRIWKGAPGLLLDVVKEWLAMEILDAALGSQTANMAKPAYAINSLERLDVSGSTIRLFGEALSYSAG